MFRPHLVGENLTPLRYPGGKRWFIKYMEQLIKSGLRPKRLIEPFGGGATVGLSMLNRDLIDNLVLVEKDPRVAAFWKAALNDPDLADRVYTFKCTYPNVIKTLGTESDGFGIRKEDPGLWLLVQNRCCFGGYLHGTPLREGNGGKGVRSNWNRDFLYDVLKQIRALRGQIEFIKGDGLEILRDCNDKDDIGFIDPPYSFTDDGAGVSIYKHHALDHEDLFDILSNRKGPWVATYDNRKEIKDLAEEYGLCYQQVQGRVLRPDKDEPKYELMLSNNFDWLKEI